LELIPEVLFWIDSGGVILTPFDRALHCKSEDLRKYFFQVYGTLQTALVHFFGNLNKKA
jgi:hypothetical protein